MLSKRGLNLKPSPTLSLATKGKELKAQGHDVISLSVGEPDWDTFAVAVNAGIEAIRNGETKYAPSSGIPELREAIANKTKDEIGIEYNPSQVTVTAGGKFTLYSAIQMLCDPGEEVIIPAPYWVSYPTMVELSDGVPVIVSCDKSTGYKLNAQQLESAITDKTKILILNSPSNPTGYMYSQEELKSLADVLKKHEQVLIISDDIYNRLLVSGGELAPHLLQVAPELKDRTVVMNGASKTFSMTGWRVGWALGPDKVISAMNKYQSQTVSCAAPFAQKATLKALLEGDSEVYSSCEKLKTRMAAAADGINNIEGLSVQKPDGAFYLWVNVSGLFGKSWQGKNIASSRDVAQCLLEDQKVILVPGIDFGLEGYVRMSYAISKERMAEALERIQKFVTSLT